MIDGVPQLDVLTSVVATNGDESKALSRAVVDPTRVGAHRLGR